LQLIEATILTKVQQSWVTAISERYQPRLRLLQSKPSGKPGEVLQLFEIDIDSDLKDELLRHLQSDPDISELAIAHTNSRGLRGLVRARGPVSRCIADSDCFLLHASNLADATMAWRVMGAQRSFRRLLGRLQSSGIDHRVIDRSLVRSKRSLTARQEWILRLALKKGYFDIPKRTHVRSLAKLVEISPPAVHESLRKSQKKLVMEYLGNA
jgi:predicted DNA binding protein